MSTPTKRLLALYGTVLIVGAMTVAGVPGIVPADHGAANAANVAIDVKPGSDENPINPNSRGVTPVAILHTEDFDPAVVDISSLRFGAPDVVEDGGGAAPAHGGHFEDVDGDGDEDLVLHFPTQAAGFEQGDDEARLVGNTTAGEQFSANATIRTVGGGSGGGPPGGPPGGGPPGGP